MSSGSTTIRPSELGGLILYVARVCGAGPPQLWRPAANERQAAVSSSGSGHGSELAQPGRAERACRRLQHLQITGALGQPHVPGAGGFPCGGAVPLTTLGSAASSSSERPAHDARARAST